MYNTCIIYLLHYKSEINDRKLIDKYGYKNGHGRRALKITLTTKNYTPQGLKLEVDEKGKKIFVTHKIGGRLWYWTVSDIRFKLGNLLLVFAERQRKGENEYFHYNEAYYFNNFDVEAFFIANQVKNLDIIPCFAICDQLV